MNLEDRVRGALHTVGDAIDVPQQSFPRSVPPRNTRTTVKLGIAMAVAISVVALAVSFADLGPEVRVATGGGVSVPKAGPGPVRGSIFMVAREFSGAAAVRLDLPKGRVTRLTNSNRQTGHIAVVGGIVYAAQGCGVGARDDAGLLRIQQSDLVPLARFPKLMACFLAPTPDGDLAWVSDGTVLPFDGSSEAGPWSVHLWDPETGRNRVVFRSKRQLGGPAVGPGGSIAVLEAKGNTFDGRDEATLVVIGPDRSITRHRLSMPLTVNTNSFGIPLLSWGPSNLLALSADGSHGKSSDRGMVLIVEPRTGKVLRKFKNWAGVAWSPDGSSLLLTRVTPRPAVPSAGVTGLSRTTFGVVSGPNLKLRVIGEAVLPGTSVDPGFLPGMSIPVAWTEVGVPVDASGVHDIASGTTRGQLWAVRSYRRASGDECVNIDLTEKTGGRGGAGSQCSASTAGILAYPLLDKGRSALLVMTLDLAVASVNLEFADGGSRRLALARRPIGKEERSMGFMPVTQPVRAIVMLDSAGKELRRLACDTRNLSKGPLGASGPCADPAQGEVW